MVYWHHVGAFKNELQLFTPGSNAYRISDIVSVKELMKELTEHIAKALSIKKIDRRCFLVFMENEKILYT